MVNKHFWVSYFYFVDKLYTLEPEKKLNNFHFFCLQNNQAKLETGKIYDPSSGKFACSCPMTKHYFDPCTSRGGLQSKKA